MQNQQARTSQLKTILDSSWEKLKIDDKISEIKKLETIVSEPEIWLNPDNAKQKNLELAELKDITEPWIILKSQLNDIDEANKTPEDKKKELIAEKAKLMEF